MATWGLGLRAKSMLALVIACLLVLLPAALVGQRLVDGVRAHFGEAYARNFTLLNRQKILAPVSRDLALSLRLADSEVTRQWLREENDPDKRALFFREAEGYRKDFRGQSYFLISAHSRNYYFNDADKPFSDGPRYVLNPQNPDDGWFFSILETTPHYNINVNPDVQLGTTRVWLNVLVRDGDRLLGLAGTGLDLGEFLEEFITVDEPGVTPIILDEDGAIQAHPDKERIAFGSTAGATAGHNRLAALLPDDSARQALAAAMAQVAQAPGEVRIFRAGLDGREQLLAISHVPELKWYVLTAVDLRAAQVIDESWIWMLAGALVLLLALLLAAFGTAVEKLVLAPLSKLHQAAGAIARGNFDVSLPQETRDEIGDLSRSFGAMAGQVKIHTAELEERVRERTAALEAANREMAAAHQKINDSIDYASLIQRAFLPDRHLAQLLGPHHFVLWRPRDVVGGDFYVFRAQDDQYLIGVVDCAGHGVPGALMTMLARSAMDHAVSRAGLGSPAAILAQTDTTLRAMLQASELPRAIATNMDAGLVAIDRGTRTLRYAGARISLYWSDGEEVGEVKGERRALADRRLGHYRDQEFILAPGRTYYLATDGYLDQAGGDLGYGFGNSRFAELLRAHARLPMHEQALAFERALKDYQGPFPQRDDITILSFRLD